MDGVKQAADAVVPLLRFLQGVKETEALIERARDVQDRERLLGQLVRDLRAAARVIDQLDTSLQAAWTLFEHILEGARAASKGGLKLRPSRSLISHQGTAIHAIDEAAAKMPAFPSNLLPEAIELWRTGLSVNSSNRLARAGFRTLLELLVFRPPTRLRSIHGLGPKVVADVRRVLSAKGYDPEEGPAPPLTILEEEPSAPPVRPAKERPAVSWNAVREQVRVLLATLGGSATISELLRIASPGSRVKKGLQLLEREGAVHRTGTRRSTRYHLHPKHDACVTPADREHL